MDWEWPRMAANGLGMVANEWEWLGMDWKWLRMARNGLGMDWEWIGMDGNG